MAPTSKVSAAPGSYFIGHMALLKNAIFLSLLLSLDLLSMGLQGRVGSQIAQLVEPDIWEGHLAISSQSITLLSNHSFKNKYEK